MAAPATSGSREIVVASAVTARDSAGAAARPRAPVSTTTTIGVGTPAPTRDATRCRPRADSIAAGIALVEAGVTEKSARPDAHAPSRTRAPARAARGRPVTARAARAQIPRAASAAKRPRGPTGRTPRSPSSDSSAGCRVRAASAAHSGTAIAARPRLRSSGTGATRRAAQPRATTAADHATVRPAVAIAAPSASPGSRATSARCRWTVSSE